MHGLKTLILALIISEVVLPSLAVPVHSNSQTGQILFDDFANGSPASQTIPLTPVTWGGEGQWNVNDVDSSTVWFPSNSVMHIANFNNSESPPVSGTLRTSFISKSTWTVASSLTFLMRVRAAGFNASVLGSNAWEFGPGWSGGSALMAYGRNPDHTPDTGIMVGGECILSTLATSNYFGQWLTANITLSAGGPYNYYFSVKDDNGNVIGSLSANGTCGTPFGTNPVNVEFFSSLGESDIDYVSVIAQSSQTAGCVSAPSGLVSWWPAEGNTVDVQGGNNGTLVGNISFSAGKVGKAFVLNGSDQYVLVGSPRNLSNFTTGITLEGWIKPNATPPVDNSQRSDIYSIVTKWSQSSATSSYGLWLNNPDGNIRLLGGVGAPTDVGQHGFYGGIVPVGVWSHVAMTYDVSTGNNTLYVNGFEVAQVNNPGGMPVSNVNVEIGKEDSTLPRFFNGNIDELSIYDRALTSLEIQSIFNASSAGKCQPTSRQPDIGVSISSASSIQSGQTLNITVGVTNPGQASSTTVSVTVNGISLGSQTATVPPNATFQFSWVTVGVRSGKYNITALATAALGESNLENNDSWTIVTVWVPRFYADLNGDGVVNVVDLVIVANSFGSTSAGPNWNPIADINGDGMINIMDLVPIAIYFGHLT